MRWSASAVGGDAAAVVADERDGHETSLARLDQGVDDAARVAARRERDQRVADAAVGDHLAREDGLRADVVRDRRDDRRIGAQVERAPRHTGAARQRPREVGDDVHGVGRRAAVAEREQRPAALEDLAAARSRRPRARLAPSRTVCSRRASVSRAFMLTESTHVGEHAVQIGLALAQERVEEARRAGVVPAALACAR